MTLFSIELIAQPYKMIHYFLRIRRMVCCLFYCGALVPFNPYPSGLIHWQWDSAIEASLNVGKYKHGSSKWKQVTAKRVPMLWRLLYVIQSYHFFFTFIAWCQIWRDNYDCRIQIRLWTNKRHPIARPHGRAMRCLCKYFCAKIAHGIRTFNCGWKQR